MNESSDMILKDNKSSLPKGIQQKKVKKTNNVAESRVSAASSKNMNDKYENTIAHLNSMLNKEKKKVREIKNLYMK